jgi:hypothetical protein
MRGSCKARTTDLSGRAVRFSNVSFSGGFIAHHYDDGSICPRVSEDHRVLVDGTEYRADEARFGGALVRPLDE